MHNNLVSRRFWRSYVRRHFGSRVSLSEACWPPRFTKNKNGNEGYILDRAYGTVAIVGWVSRKFLLAAIPTGGGQLILRQNPAKDMPSATRI